MSGCVERLSGIYRVPAGHTSPDDRRDFGICRERIPTTTLLTTVYSITLIKISNEMMD